MAESAAVVPDQPIQVGDGGGQVWPLTLVDEQSANGLEPITIDGRQLDPIDEFDRIYFHGIHRSRV